MRAQPEGLMEPADVWGARWNVCDNTLARQYMEVVCRKQSMVVLAADLNTMGEPVSYTHLTLPTTPYV